MRRQTEKSSTAPDNVNLLRLASLAIAAASLTCTAQQAPAPGSGIDSTLPITTLKAVVRRVNVDIVVTDSHGRPVTGLSQADFKVEEDKKVQGLRSFDIHTTNPTAPFTPPAIPALPPNTFLNVAKSPDVGTPTVILYDALNSSLADQSYGRQQMLEFVKHRRPGGQIAIFILAGKLHLLQGFTDDTDLLATAMASKRARPQTTNMLDGASVGSTTATSDNPLPTTQIQAPPGQTGGTVTGEDPDQAFTDALDKAREFDQQDKQQQQDERVELTLSALTDIGRFLSPLPGRKNLIWLSSAFPVGILPDPTMTVRPPGQAGSEVHDRDMRDYSGQIKKATDLLNLSHVSVYPVDVRGVRINESLTASSNASFGANPSFGGAQASLKQDRNTNKANSSTSLSLSQQNFIMDDQASRMTMDTLADDTGGHAFYGTNGLEQAVDSALLSGSTYYSLTYEPTNPSYDGSLRHVKVSLKKSGYNLAYRKTYFADDLTAVAHAAADAPESALTPALERGIPLTRDLLLEAHLEASGAPVAASPRQMQILSQYEAMRDRKNAKKTPPVMMQQYVVSYGLVAHQLDITADDTGTRKAVLEFGIISYDEDGRKVYGLDSHVTDTIPPARYEKLASEGYRAVQSIAIPVTAASLRIAVRDMHSNRVGSLEVQLPLAAPKTSTK